MSHPHLKGNNGCPGCTFVSTPGIKFPRLCEKCETGLTHIERSEGVPFGMIKFYDANIGKTTTANVYLFTECDACHYNRHILPEGVKPNEAFKTSFAFEEIKT